MPLDRIVLFTARAFAFALPIALLLTAIRHMYARRCKRRVSRRVQWLRFFFILYLLMLIEITAIRDGAHLFDFWTYPHGMQTVQPIPFSTTINEISLGLWPALYHILGNVAWFVPLGFLLRALRPTCTLLRVALTSAILSCAIEAMQWVFLSGISDIDDVLMNLCGGLLGFLLHWLYQRGCNGRSRPSA